VSAPAPGDLAGTTARAAFEQLRAAFAAAGLDTPEADARLLIGHVLGFEPRRLVLEGARIVDADAAARLADLAARRLAREPVARLIGHWSFWGMDFALSPETLVPRPETETLVEAVLGFADHHGGRARAFVLADLGTGTGAILAALLRELPEARGIAVDLSLGAARTAQENLRTLGLSRRARVVAGSWAGALAQGAFDIVVSNPPYVTPAEIEGLDPEVRTHDPRLALDGGEDGLDAYRALVPEALAALRPGGLLALEVGETQAHAVASLLAAAGALPAGPPRRDLLGHARVVAGLAP